jgi:hypothetical protein
MPWLDRITVVQQDVAAVEPATESAPARGQDVQIAAELLERARAEAWH